MQASAAARYLRATHVNTASQLASWRGAVVLWPSAVSAVALCLWCAL
jgi:hypothetical protein